MRTRHLLLRLLAVPALLLSLSVAACAGDNGPDNVAATPDAATVEHEQRLKFAKCMREQGLDFPDPQAPAADAVAAAPAVKIEDAAKFEAAMTACRQFMPNGGEVRQPSAEDLALLRAFAKCMREQGLDYPDPVVDGNGVGEARAIVPEDMDKLTAAQKICDQKK